MEPNHEQASDYRTFKWMMNTFVVFTIFTITGCVGILLSLVIGRPWFEGLGFGAILALAAIYIPMSNPDFAAFWERQTREDFEASEQQTAAAWRREQERPDDEYVGW